MSTALPLSDDSVRVRGILSDISSLGANFTAGDLDSRDALLEAARSLITAIELPSQAVFRMILAEPARNMAVRVAHDLDIFEQLNASSRMPKSNIELAAKNSADPVLTNRILKHLAAMQIIHESSASSYLPTPLSHALASPAFRGGFKFGIEACGPVFTSLPAYLASTSHASPTNDVTGPFQFAHRTRLLHWDWVVAHSELHRAFNDYESGYHAGRPFWTGIYPVRERLIDGAEGGEEGVLIVDQGGGKGHDLEEFVERMGMGEREGEGEGEVLDGKLVLQDLPAVVEQARTGLNPRVTAMAHDFFEDQPVRGARAYFMHTTLHDWNDEKGILILEALVPAFKPGYSKLLIHEQIVPDVGASWKITAHDLIMMGNFASHERSYAQWKTLLESAGFKITGVWSSEDPAAESVMEAVLATDEA